MLYIQVTTPEEEAELIRRAQSDPKPLYFRPAFLAEYLPKFLAERELADIAAAAPDDFTRSIRSDLGASQADPRIQSLQRALTIAQLLLPGPSSVPVAVDAAT